MSDEGSRDSLLIAPRPALSVEAVLFDAVGTLIHLRELVGSTYARYATAAGLRVSASALQGAFAATLKAMPPMVFAERAPALVAAAERGWWRQLVGRVFSASGIDGSSAPVDAVFERLFAYYASADAWLCAPGALPLLERLRGRGLKTGVVSNFDHRLRPLLAELGLAARLDVVVLPADAGAAKPDARIFALALERLSVSASDALYVGDDAEDDVAGAQGAGMQAVDVGALADLAELEALLSVG